MRQILLKAISLSLLLSAASVTDAKDWFGKNNRFGGGNSFFGNNNGCNDWPEWTPMYWMEEMRGNNDSCYPNSYGGRYANPYQSAYSSYGGASPYLANPYMARSPYGYGGLPAYGAQQRRGSRGFSPFGNAGMSSFPGFGGGNGFSNPFSGFSGGSSPFSSFGGGSPWSSFGSPMSSPMGLGGFGSPFSPMSPMSMGTMGMPGMSPFGGMGSSMPFGGGSSMPFGGGSGFSPFR